MSEPGCPGRSPSGRAIVRTRRGSPPRPRPGRVWGGGDLPSGPIGKLKAWRTGRTARRPGPRPGAPSSLRDGHSVRALRRLRSDLGGPTSIQRMVAEVRSTSGPVVPPALVCLRVGIVTTGPDVRGISGLVRRARVSVVSTRESRRRRDELPGRRVWLCPGGWCGSVTFRPVGWSGPVVPLTLDGLRVVIVNADDDIRGAPGHIRRDSGLERIRSVALSAGAPGIE